MKKILGAMLLAALALSGCIKSENPYAKYKPVAGGMQIFSVAYTQFDVAIQPANAAMRLAILLAEADKQAETSDETVDFSKITHDGKNVMASLFGSYAKIEKDSGNTGDYRITYSTDVMLFGYYYKGSMIVKTGNVPLSETNSETAWTVEYDDFKVLSSGGYTVTVKFNGGETTLYANGDASFTVKQDNMDLNYEGSEAHSNWSGSFRMRPEANGIAYSECTGKDFSVNGSFSGPTFTSLMKNNEPTRVSYTVSNGKYKLYGKVFTGTLFCHLTGYGDYNPADFPSTEVEYIYSYDEARGVSQTIKYNGNIVTD